MHFFTASISPFLNHKPIGECIVEGSILDGPSNSYVLVCSLPHHLEESMGKHPHIKDLAAGPQWYTEHALDTSSIDVQNHGKRNTWLACHHTGGTCWKCCWNAWIASPHVGVGDFHLGMLSCRQQLISASICFTTWMASWNVVKRVTAKRSLILSLRSHLKLARRTSIFHGTLDLLYNSTDFRAQMDMESVHCAKVWDSTYAHCL